MKTRSLFAHSRSHCRCITGDGAADLPPGKWWRRPEIVQKLELTEDQQNRLDDDLPHVGE